MSRRTAGIYAALALVATLLVAPGQAQAAGIPCFGPPAGYVAAHDAKDGSVDGIVGYPEPRVYLEVQGWVTRPGVTPGQASEHIHSGTCFPHGETWANQVARLDYQHDFFNLIGYRVSRIRGGMESAGIGIGSFNTSSNLSALNAAENASAGGQHTTVYQSYTLNIPAAKCSGRAEWRTGIEVVSDGTGKALVPQWFTSTGWQSYLPAGKPACSFRRASDAVIFRNWTTPFDYGNSGMGVVKASTWDDPKPEPSYGQTVGFGSGTNRGSLHVDPHFHDGDQGIFTLAVTSGGSKSIPTGSFSSGIHRVVFLAHEGGGSAITSSVVGLLPIRVS